MAGPSVLAEKNLRGSVGLRASDILYLQRCAGNQAVCSLLAGEEKGQLQVSRLLDVPEPGGDLMNTDDAWLGTIGTAPPKFSKACDVAPLRRTTTPVPEAKGVASKDLEWIDQIKPTWYRDQVDGLNTNRDFRKETNVKALASFDARAQNQITTCTKQEDKRIGAIKNEQERNRAREVSTAKVKSLQEELVGLRHREEERLEGGRTRNREAFVETMRCVLNSEPKDHFLNLKQASAVPSAPWLYKDAADRMELVKADLDAHALEMPPVSDAIDLRGRHMQHAQPMGHPLGLSVDFYPYDNPQIKDKRHIALIEMVSGRSGHVEVGEYGRRRALVGQMGEEHDNPATEQDPKVQAFFKIFDAEFASLQQASVKFQGDLKGADRALLNTLKQRYIDMTVASRELAQQEQQLKANPPKDAKQLAEAKKKLDEDRTKLDKEKADITSRLIDAFKPWVDRLADTIKADYNLLRDLDRAEPVLTKIAKAEKNLADARSGKQKKKATPTQLATWQAEIDQGNLDIADVLPKLDGKPGVAPQSRSAAPRLTKLATMRTDSSKEMTTLVELYKSLTGDLNFVFGPVMTVKQKGKADTHQLAPDVRNVPVMQLIERGYFNPMKAFNLAFFKTMIKRGFDAGVTWRGTTDPMHFDFVKGFTGINEGSCGLELPKT